MRNIQVLILGLFLTVTNVAWTSPYNTVTISTKTATSAIDIRKRLINPIYFSSK